MIGTFIDGLKLCLAKKIMESNFKLKALDKKKLSCNEVQEKIKKVLCFKCDTSGAKNTNTSLDKHL